MASFIIRGGLPCPLRLRPRQAVEAPAVVRIAMMALVEIALETVLDIVDIMHPGFFKRLTGLCGAPPGAADEQYGAVDAGGLAYMRDKHRVDLPFRAVHPGDVDGTSRMADKHVFHLAAHVDKHRFGIGLQEVEGFLGGEVLHDRSPCLICFSLPGL